MSRIPVYEQIIEETRRFIAAGLLKAGDQMPSVRSLSMELSVNPNTIQKAFTELYNRGLIVSVPGRGSFVSNDAPDIIRQNDRKLSADFIQLAKRLHDAGMSEDELKGLIYEALADK